MPHLTPEAIEEMKASIPPHQLKARMEGTPTLGSGAIYPIDPETYVVSDFPLPSHWFRSYSIDVGWNVTCALWGAEDRDTGTVYVYSEHYAGQAIPAIHSQAIQARDKQAGFRLAGVCDPAARGRSQIDGQQLIQTYRDLGLDLEPAINTVEAGIYDVWQRFVAGKLKIFASCASLLGELKLYRRDEKGHVVKSRDHACDALRYLILSGLQRGIQKPATTPAHDPFAGSDPFGAGGWMG